MLEKEKGAGRSNEARARRLAMKGSVEIYE
jgi:hypothetical protein